MPLLKDLMDCNQRFEGLNFVCKNRLPVESDVSLLSLFPSFAVVCGDPENTASSAHIPQQQAYTPETNSVIEHY